MPKKKAKKNEKMHKMPDGTMMSDEKMKKYNKKMSKKMMR